MIQHSAVTIANATSAEQEDSRKRRLDDGTDEGASKRSHISDSAGEILAKATGDNYHFKLLIPSAAAGAIIGKGGETIALLQKDASARVKMSKANEMYPGTSDRVCLISGTVDGILSVLNFMLDKVHEKLELDSKQENERGEQVKVLVPNSTAGMIIGKAGAYIKQINQESGSHLQISQKPKDLSLQERCITIVGQKENNKIACRLVLGKIVEDPQSGSCLTITYTDATATATKFNAPALTQNPTFNASTVPLSTTTNTTLQSAPTTGITINGTGLNLALNLDVPSAQSNTVVMTQVLENIKNAMRQSGYSDSATAEVHAALSVLAKYGILGLQNRTQQTAGHNLFNVQDILLPSAATATFDQMRTSAVQAAAPITINSSFLATNTSALNATIATQKVGSSTAPAETAASEEKNVEIPEVIVGAILGPAGRSLVEIQHLSGANIQISKKGIFAPGTRNRIVTITGAPNALNVAQYLIEQRIQEEEAKRASQNITMAKLPVAAVSQ